MTFPRIKPPVAYVRYVEELKFKPIHNLFFNNKTFNTFNFYLQFIKRL